MEGGRVEGMRQEGCVMSGCARAHLSDVEVAGCVEVGVEASENATVSGWPNKGGCEHLACVA